MSTESKPPTPGTAPGPPQPPPRIPERLLEVPDQRYYVLGLGLACQVRKLFCEELWRRAPETTLSFGRVHIMDGVHRLYMLTLVVGGQNLGPAPILDVVK